MALASRLPVLAEESAVRDVFELDQRLRAFPGKERVTVLVLGNSHAVAGLRPQALARAMGIGEHEVFSLAVPGGSPREMRLLLERYRPFFPQARRVLCGLDEYFLGENIDLRLRYLTRRSLAERWDYAQRLQGWGDRLSLVGSWFCPVVDFSVMIKTAAGSPQRLIRRLATANPQPGAFRRQLAAIDYPWGYPPPWAHRGLVPAPERYRLQAQTADAIIRRVDHFLNDQRDLESGWHDLMQLVEAVERNRLEPILVQMPYTPKLTETLKRLKRQDYARYERRLADVRLRGWPRLLAPPIHAAEDYHDADHLNPNGASKLAAWLAARLVAR